MSTLKTKSLRINLYILLSAVLVSCQKKDDELFSFQDKQEYVNYNVVKKTKFPPTTGHTFVFKKNGDFFHFEYLINNSDGDNRYTENKHFFNPYVWKTKGDSILIEDTYYKMTPKSKDEIILSRKKYDTLWLKRIENDFGVEFYKRKPTFIHTVNAKGDTIGKAPLRNL